MNTKSYIEKFGKLEKYFDEHSKNHRQLLYHVGKNIGDVNISVFDECDELSVFFTKENENEDECEICTLKIEKTKIDELIDLFENFALFLRARKTINNPK